MVISGSGQPSKLVDLIAVSQLVGPPPARRIIGLVTVGGVSHFLILRPGFSSTILTATAGSITPRPPAPGQPPGGRRRDFLQMDIGGMPHADVLKSMRLTAS